jgi:glucose-1-phosphate thymidylyltransferase
MKALILAGGRGTRLRPLTHTTNKHLLPIANQPMIVRVIEDAVDLGVDQVIININKGDTELPSVIGDGSTYHTRITYIEQPTPNGMMYPIKLAEKLIGDDDFLFSAGDNILVGGFRKHYDEFKKKKSDAHVLVVRRPDYQQFGVAVLDGDRVVRTVEKPKRYISDLVLTAIYFFTPAVFTCMDKVKPIDPKGTGKPEYYPPVVINWMVKHGYTFTASEITGWWKDTGMPQDIIEANSFVLARKENFAKKGKVENSKVEGRIDLPSTSRIRDSVVRGPVSIGEYVQIEKSYIGPYTSIGNNSSVSESQIENSIVMEDVTISNVKRRLDGCLIGKGSNVTESEQRPEAATLYIGDDSQVIL